MQFIKLGTFYVNCTKIKFYYDAVSYDDGELPPEFVLSLLGELDTEFSNTNPSKVSVSHAECNSLSHFFALSSSPLLSFITSLFDKVSFTSLSCLESIVF